MALEGVTEWTLFGVSVVGVLIIVAIIVIIISAIRTRRIKKKAPQFTGNLSEIRDINFDPKDIERREIQYGKEIHEGGRQDSGVGGETSTNSGREETLGQQEEEILKEIARLRRRRDE